MPGLVLAFPVAATAKAATGYARYALPAFSSNFSSSAR